MKSVEIEERPYRRILDVSGISYISWESVLMLEDNWITAQVSQLCLSEAKNFI
jgi:hypothetical protein